MSRSRRVGGNGRCCCCPSRTGSTRSVRGQLHFELDASVKLFTELTTLAASLVTVAICAADGVEGRAVTEFLSALTDEEMALVSLGKSLLAELTSVVASVWICLSCDFKPLIPLAVRLVSPVMEFWRLVRSVQ